MAILSDQEIWGLISSGRLKIDPPPALEAVSPSTIDLTLAHDFIVPQVWGGQAAQTSIDTRDSTSVMNAIEQLSTEEVVPEGESFDLAPGRFVLAWTRETIGLPNFLAARVEGRSTAARLGLSVHQSAPTVHPTFHERLQLELTNAGPYTLKLYPGQRICQLIIETMSLPSVKTLDSVHTQPTETE